jgi:hypothetical protein
LNLLGSFFCQCNAHTNYISIELFILPGRLSLLGMVYVSTQFRFRDSIISNMK